MCTFAACAQVEGTAEFERNKKKKKKEKLDGTGGKLASWNETLGGEKFLFSETTTRDAWKLKESLKVENRELAAPATIDFQPIFTSGFLLNGLSGEDLLATPWQSRRRIE